MLAIWKFQFHDLAASGSPPGDLLYSNVAGISGHTRKILNFSSITEHCDLTSGAIPSVSTSFEIDDPDKLLDSEDFLDEYVTITFDDDDTIEKSWKLKIVSVVYSYGTHKLVCESELSSFENEKFPPYASIKSLAPQLDEVPENLCAPYIVGKAYIPIYPILSSGNRRYLLGKSDDVTGDFTISQVRSPRDYPSVSYWDDSYTYNISDKSLQGVSYQITDMIIAQSTTGGAVDSNGIFQTGGKILSPLVEFEGDDTSKKPGAFILDVLQKAGLTNCNSASFTGVDSSYFSDVTWAGGFWEHVDLETLVSNLLSQCDCYFTQSNQIYLNAFDSTPVETFDKSAIIDGSFSISAVRKSNIDGGNVRWRWYGEPEDVLTAEYSVHLETTPSSSGLPDNPDTAAFEYPYGVDETSENALKFGILHFQKKHSKKAQISFSSKIDKLSDPESFAPGQVVDIDDDNDSAGGIQAAYDNLDILVYETVLHADGKIDINGYAYDTLEDFVSVNAYPVYPEGDTSTDVVVGDAAAVGDDTTTTCMGSELYDVYGISPTQSAFSTTKAQSKSAASNLWSSLGDSAKWEPWDGASVTTNHTWTGDTGDFSITSEALTATITAGNSSTISLASLDIHAESLRISSTITIIGTNAATYCRIKLTDEDSTVRYFYLGNGDSGWSDDADEFLIGSGTLTKVLSTYGLVEKITNVSIECACHSGDTSIEISIAYIDFEYRHDLLDACGSCSGADAGAYAVKSGSVVYAYYYDGCETGGATSSSTSYNSYYHADTHQTGGTYVGAVTIVTNYDPPPWQVVYIDSSDGPVNCLLPQETDYSLKINDRILFVDYHSKAETSGSAISVSFCGTPCEGQTWNSIEMISAGASIECIWTGAEMGWHQLQNERLPIEVSDYTSYLGTNMGDGTGTTYWEVTAEWEDLWSYNSSNNTFVATEGDPEMLPSIYVRNDGANADWTYDFDPTHVRITFTGTPAILGLKDGNGVLIASATGSPSSPCEMEITWASATDSVTGGYIALIRTEHQDCVITDIEFKGF